MHLARSEAQVDRLAPALPRQASSAFWHWLSQSPGVGVGFTLEMELELEAGGCGHLARQACRSDAQLDRLAPLLVRQVLSVFWH